MKLRCACHRHDDGPTVCMAHPRVVADIRAHVRSAKVLSATDARLARSMGLIDIPSVGRLGWNDGVVYPPDDVPTDRPTRGRTARPLERVQLARAAGTLNCLVLLVDFADNPGRTPAAHYERLLFDADDPASMTSFYRDMSYGRLNVAGQVVGWLRMPQPYSYYVNRESGTGTAFPRNTPGLLRDALDAYTRTNSLAPFDVNGDGFVDGLFLVHAGPGAEAQVDAAKRRTMIWSHKWTLPSVYEKNGVKAFAYFTAPEDGRLGVFAHEFGHFLGLPDLYDTSYRSRGVGDWCLMAGGSWGGGGDRPTRLSAWCLASLGWIAPRNVRTARTIDLKPLEGSRSACLRVWSGGRSGPEYFLLENRQQSGRDAALPGHGLLVWHVDERQSDNTNPIAYRVGVVQADGRRDLELNKNDGDGADTFPGTARVTRIDDRAVVGATLRANDGSATGLAVSGIVERDGVVRVRLKV